VTRFESLCTTSAISLEFP
jgi:hypothetical protein